MKTRLIALLTATCILAGCQKSPPEPAADTNSTAVAENSAATENAASAAMADTTAKAAGGQLFANTAAASDAFEVASSKLADANGSSAAVKRFATQMIAAHTESTAKLKSTTAALSPPITPDPTLTPDQQAKLDDLKAKKGAEFDAAYVSDQVAAHEQTLSALQAYSTGGEVPELKAFATALAPKVAAHLNMAKAIKP